jgi:hypothetical protein
VGAGRRPRALVGQPGPASKGARPWHRAVTEADDRTVRIRLIVGLVTVGVIVGLVWAWRALGPASVGFAFVVVWLPMTWLGTLSRIGRPRLPATAHRLRAWELDGRVYERLGVRLVKGLLRRGPLAVFNPGLHLPAEPTPERIALLDQRMRDAEAAHAILFVLTLGVVAHALARGWWAAAVATAVFDVAVNGYPVMLQRYNRARLHRRFDAPPPHRPCRGA